VSKALAVAARDLRERWLLFPAALVVGLAPFLVSPFGLHAEQAPVVGLFVAIMMGAVAAVVAGASMLARDVTDGHLAFLFSRPVPWAAIWGGKWLAAVVLVFGSATLALVPVIVTYPPPSPGGDWRSVLLGSDRSALFLVLLFLGIGLANFNSTALRSRSAWLALDLGLVLLALRLTWLWVAPLFVLLAPWSRSVELWWVVFPGVPALALLLASAVQVWIGRTDLRRAHRALSVGFWSLIFVALAAAGLRLAWVRAATPVDLTAYAGGTSDPSGRWLNLSGESARGGGATFLIDTDRGPYVPMGVHAYWKWPFLSGMVFAADGGSGVVLLREPEHSVLRRVDLSEDLPTFTDLELESSPPPTPYTRVALSATGRTVILAHEGGASLFEVPSGQRIATAAIPPGWRPAAVRFLEERAARVWLFPVLGLPYGSHPPAEMRVMDLVVGREPETRATPLETVVDHVRSWPHLVRLDHEGHRVLTYDGGVRLRDGATGALVATLYEGSAQTSEAFLADGRVVVAAGPRKSLQVFSPEGSLLGEVAFDRVASPMTVSAELAPGRIAVRFARGPDGPETVVVDINERRVLQALPELEALWPPYPFDAPAAGHSIRHFLIEDGAIVRWDFGTGERRVVAGPGARPGERLAARW